MKRFLLLFLINILVASLLLVYGCQSSTTISPATTDNTTTTNPTTPVVGNKVGNLAPGFQLKDLEGNTISLNDLRGSPVIINFWRID